jgi:hypothetical protein
MQILQAATHGYGKLGLLRALTLANQAAGMRVDQHGVEIDAHP